MWWSCGGVWWIVAESRERCGVGGGIGVEEVLLLEGRTVEQVEKYRRMVDEMWREGGWRGGAGGVGGEDRGAVKIKITISSAVHQPTVK